MPDADKPKWECPRCGRKFDNVDHKHSWTGSIGGIIECEKATPEQIAEYKKFNEARELRRKAAKEEEDRITKEEAERIARGG